MPCFPPKMVTSSFIKILYSRIGCPFVAAMTISCVWDPFEASKSLEEPINWAVFNRTLKGTSGGVFVCFCSCLIVFLTVCSCLFCRFPFSVPDVIQVISVNYHFCPHPFTVILLPSLGNLCRTVARNREILSSKFDVDYVLASRTIRDFDERLTHR